MPLRADRLLDGAGPDHGAGAAADPARRPARAQHLRAPAGQGRRDGGPLGDPARRAARSCSRCPTRRPRPTTSRSRSRSSAAWILTHELDGVVPGLKEWPPEDRPYVPLVFFAFRLMVGIGLLMLAVAVVQPARCGCAGGCTRRAGSSGSRSPACRSASSRCWPAGSRPKSGRQPWVVYGLMRTADAVTPALTGARGRDLARGVRDRLRADLPGRRLLHGPAGAARAAAERCGARRA